MLADKRDGDYKLQDISLRSNRETTRLRLKPSCGRRRPRRRPPRHRPHGRPLTHRARLSFIASTRERKPSMLTKPRTHPPRGTLAAPETPIRGCRRSGAQLLRWSCTVSALRGSRYSYMPCSVESFTFRWAVLVCTLKYVVVDVCVYGSYTRITCRPPGGRTRLNTHKAASPRCVHSSSLSAGMS